jgi:hypothetical protein
MKRAILTLLSAALLAAVTACDNEPAAPPADYFPTRANAAWHYANTTLDGFGSEVWGTDTTTFRIGQDTLVDGKKYVLLADAGGRYKWGIRKEKGNYYLLPFEEFNRYTERVFLKDGLPAGSRWEEFSPDGFYKYVYTITARLPEKTIRGNVYRDVIEVEEERFFKGYGDEYNSPGKIQHCYAKNVGEVYAHYPPYAFGTYATQKLELLEYTPN